MGQIGHLCGVESAEGFICRPGEGHLQAASYTLMTGERQYTLIPDAADEEHTEKSQLAGPVLEGSLSELDTLSIVQRGSAEFPSLFT